MYPGIINILFFMLNPPIKDEDYILILYINFLNKIYGEELFYSFLFLFISLTFVLFLRFLRSG